MRKHLNRYYASLVLVLCLFCSACMPAYRGQGSSPQSKYRLMEGSSIRVTTISEPDSARMVTIAALTADSLIVWPEGQSTTVMIAIRAQAR